MAEDKKKELPQLQQAQLDQNTIQELFTDIEELCSVLAVIPKHNVEENSSQPIDLGTGRAMLLGNELRSLQIRYVYESEEWWDTIIAKDGIFHLTRMKQAFQ